MNAVIDIGSNSVRLLVAEIQKNRVLPVDKKVVITRLGEGVDFFGLLKSGGIERTLTALKSFKEHISYNVPTWVLGTSAIRVANNRSEFIDLVRSETGWDVQVLSGAQEAQLSFLGAVASLPKSKLIDPVSVLDIGGGSTEIYTGLATGKLLGGGSVELGAVRLLERVISEHPVSEWERKRMEKITKKLLEPLVFKNLKLRPQTLVAVGGTALSVAAMNKDLAVFDEAKLNGSILQQIEVGEVYAEFLEMSLEERRSLQTMQAGREDVIVCGACIFWKAVSLLDFSKIFISTGDLLSGYLLLAVDGGR